MVPSSSSPTSKKYLYDVFLSFRGDDIRKTFVDHFYEALQQRNIRTFKDDEGLHKGEMIKGQLLKSIEDSRFYIILFSKNYASSSWCLDELVKIMECHKMPGHIAFPVFYDVEPSEIRNQSGVVEKAFDKYINEDAARKWRDAMKQAGNLASWVLKNISDGHEAKFIKKIVKQISLKLHSNNVYIDKNIIGMEPRMEKVLPTLDNGLENGFDDVRMIGINGIGGGGKTTLARAIFDRISIHFDGVSFVENVRKVSETSGLQVLQKQVLSDVLKDQHIIVSSVNNGKSMLQNMLGNKKVLLVLDDVDHISQLEALAGDLNWFKDGSRIIITTREEQVLRAHSVHAIHNVDLLSNEEAICLLSRYAFRKDIPDQRYIEQVREVVNYAAGLPLIITVLGGYLCDKDELEWTDQLKKLKSYPLKGTLEILELSYISLADDHDKQLFLDIACFLKLSHKDDAIRILESCKFYPTIGLKNLEQKSLITILDDQRLGMHDRIQEMGMNIVRRDHPDDPSRHSRLWIRGEIEDILANDMGTADTKAIAVDDSHLELSSEIVTKGFRNMRLRFLRLVSEKDDDYHHWDEMNNQVRLDLPCTLRYLSWAFYPYLSLPVSFKANDLVALELPDCRIRQLWEAKSQKVVLNKLRFLVLRYSKLKTLDLGLTPNLEKLDLDGCFDLEELHTPVGCLKRLVSLNLSGCVRLTSFLFISRLESIEFLSLKRLYLKGFQDILPSHNNLLELRLRNNDIDELPASIGDFDKLVYLDLQSCRQLKRLPGSISSLLSIKKLKLGGCNLEDLPEDIGRLRSLENLNLSYTRITHLPDSMCTLKHLKNLNLSFCGHLANLPEDLGRLECLQKLVLKKCTRVSHIPDSICQLKRLKYFSVFGCYLLEKLPKELGALECLKVLNVEGTRIRQLPRRLYLLGGLKIYEAKSVLQSPGYASTSGKRKFDHL